MRNDSIATTTTWASSPDTNTMAARRMEGFDGAETTVALSQLVELGGKRKKRQQVVAMEENLANWDYRIKKLDLVTTMAEAFYQLLSVQEQVAQNAELVQLAEKTLDTVNERSEAGKISPIELMQTRIELASMQNQRNKTLRLLTSARSRLASFWGAADQSV